MILPIEDPADPRVARFVGLTRDDSKQPAAETFVVEGRTCVRLLAQSELAVEAMLVQSGREHEAASWSHDSVPLYVVDAATIRAITGFDFHRGFLALGRRPKIGSMEQWVADISALTTAGSPGPAPISLASVGVSERDNLGIMIRTAAGLGIGRILTCPRSADPFSRRAVRTSMATVLGQSIYQMRDPESDFVSLASAGFRTVVTTLASGATPLDQFEPDDRPVVLAIGNESDGVPAAVQAVATDRLTIPMAGGVDSLNAAVAAGIMMYQVAAKIGFGRSESSSPLSR